MHRHRAAEAERGRGGDVACLGDDGGLHAAAEGGDVQPFARGRRAILDDGADIMAEHAHGHADAGGVVAGVERAPDLTDAGQRNEGRILIERAVRALARGGVARGAQGEVFRRADAAAGIDEGADFVKDGGDGERANELRARLRHRVLARLGAGIELEGKAVAAGDTADQLGLGAVKLLGHVAEDLLHRAYEAEDGGPSKNSTSSAAGRRTRF